MKVSAGALSAVVAWQDTAVAPEGGAATNGWSAIDAGGFLVAMLA
jgi:hypothetical protein